MQEPRSATRAGSPPWWHGLLAWVLMLTPSLVYLVHVGDFARLPQNDYYGVMTTLVGDRDHLPRNPLVYLTVKSNEHRVTFPAMVYAANAAWNHGNNVGLSLFAVGLLFVLFVLAYRLLPAELRRRPWLRVPAGLALAALVFTPVAAHCVFLGFSGTIWFFSNVFALAAIAAWVHDDESGRHRHLWLALGFGILGAFAYSSHLSIWPALLLGALLIPGPRWRFLALAAAAAAVYGLYAASYHKPEHHPDLNTSDAGSLWDFAAVYLGGFLGREVETAQLAGRLGLAAAVVVFVLLLFASPRRRVLLAPWCMLMVYALGNTFGTAVGRSGIGLKVALSSRYASINSLFWVGLVASLLLWLHASLPAGGRARKLGLGLGLGVVAVAAFIATMYSAGSVEIDRQLKIARNQPMGELASFWGIQDPHTLRWISPATDQVFWARKFFRSTGHVPFDRERPPLTHPIAPELLASLAPAELRGGFQHLEPLANDVARVEGWAELAGRRAEKVVLVDARGTAHGEIATGLLHGDDAHAPRTAWCGYLLLDAEAGQLDAFARFEPDGPFYPLPTADAVRQTFARTWAERDVILITVDTLRADRLGAYGYAAARTPTIDRLATRGRWFERATTPLPRTTPALASLLTGLLPVRHGSREVAQPLMTGASFVERLKERGFVTLGVSANGAAGPRQKLDRGFDTLVDAKELKSARAEAVTARALELAREAVKERPLFLWVHYVDPHFPYAPPGHWRDQPEAESCRRATTEANRGRTQTAHLVDNLGGRAAKVVAECSQLYDAEIAYTDAAIGQLFDGLAGLGRLEESIVVLTADHGENLGEWGLYFEHGPNLHDASLRVPLIIAGPGIVPGVDRRVARLQDVAPTLLAMLGEPRETWAAMDGVDLEPRKPQPSVGGGLFYAESGTPLLVEVFAYPVSGRAHARNCTHGPRFSLCGTPEEEPKLYDHVEDPDLTRDLSERYPEEKAALLAVRRRWPAEQARQRAVGDGRFKLVEYPRLEGGYRRALYDLESDPAEEQDVARENREVAMRLGAALDAWTAEQPAPTGIELSEDELDTLRALGYVN